jgi:hypothetical protein
MLAFWAVLFVIGAGSAAHAVTQNSTWTGTGTGQNWSDNDNWSPVLSIPPINELIANLEFNVTIPSPACSGHGRLRQQPSDPEPGLHPQPHARIRL